VLEVEWAILFDRHNFDSWYHPGPVALEHGQWWEPDFRVGEVLCEVKPHKGASTEREWKPREAARIYELPVLLLRPGVYGTDWDDEKRGADWESTDDSTWVVVWDPDEKSMSFSVWSEELDSRYVLWSARECMMDPAKAGLEFPHWSEATKVEE